MCSAVSFTKLQVCINNIWTAKLVTHLVHTYILQEYTPTSLFSKTTQNRNSYGTTGLHADGP
jgi:hypothetical protein